MKITIVTSEALPFAKTGGLADVATALGKEFIKLGHEVTLMMPMYSGISVIPTGLITPLSLSFSGRYVTYSIVESRHERIKMVFVDAPAYFHRPGVYGDSSGGYRDNDERFIFFTRACLEYYERKGERPDVFHCNDWPTGLFPLFLRTHYLYDDVSKAAVLFTIHNAAYQGTFPKDRFGLLELGWEYFTTETLEFFDTVSFLKAGLLYSDILTTVSKKYSSEIQTNEFGYKMEGVLQKKSDRLFGILNGIDDEVWNPEKDKFIAENYSLTNPEGKNACRKELLASSGWPEDLSRPVIGIISRLVAQKGLDLLEAAAERILNMNTVLVVLGSGEPRYETYFDQLFRKRPDQLRLAVEFDNVFAHKIEAGADMFLMPSRFEPCGLNQMYSLKYGTVPIVRATGGLDDTVREWDAETESGNGFKFYDYNAEQMLEAIARACHAFENKETWRKIIENGMREDYSWRHSALQYLELYEKAIQLKS